MFRNAALPMAYFLLFDAVMFNSSAGRFWPSQVAFTFVETVVAMMIVSVGFAALYALSSQCLYLLASGRETMAAGESLHDRMEQMRNSTWTQLTNPSFIQTKLSTPADSTANLSNASETVTISVYPPPAAPTAPIQVTRKAGSTSAVISGPNPNAAVAAADMVQIDLQLNWTASPHARARSQSTSTIYAKNTK